MDHRRTAVGCLALVAIPCAAILCGCAEFQSTRIDPTGRRLFAEAPPVYRDEPGPMASWDPVDLILTPRVTVAPVGSEVVLVAGVRGQDQYLITNERLHWTLDQGGVGEFVQIQPGAWCDFLVCDFTRPHLVNATYAIGSTSRKNIRLTRGTPTTEDDVCVLRGQSWISVSSPIEGTSLVTAFAPSVYGWEQRKQTATIHWVDAQWRFPPPAINPAGTRHVFTTTVMRQTDQAPCAGWRVRYQIADGPAAGFAPSGTQSVDVETNAMGQASAEIFQQRPAPGTNRINIQVIRPASHGAQQIAVGMGSTMKTWSAPGVCVRKTGPAVVGVGATANYRIQVSNPGDVAAENVVVVDEIPETMSLVGTNPPTAPTGRKLQWQLGRLGPGGCQAINVTLRAERPGSAASCAEATANGGLKARDCVTTTIATAAVSAPLTLKITGPDRATVGTDVTFEILVTNPGDTTNSDLVIKDRFDAGFQHAKAASPIERRLPPLGPRQSAPISITFRVVGTGRLCHTVELIDKGVVLAKSDACLTATAGSPTTPPTTPPVTRPTPEPPASGQTQPPPPVTPTSPPAVSVRITGAKLRNVGEQETYEFLVQNTGGQTLTNVIVVSESSKELQAEQATSDYKPRGDNALAWEIRSLMPGRPQTYQVRYRMLQPAKEACIRVRVTAAEGVQGEDKFCLEIRGAPATRTAGLDVKVTSLHNPTTQGKESTFDIQVTNNGQTPESQLVLDVAVPPEMAPVRLLTAGPAGVGVNFREGQVVHFDPLPLLNPGQSASYRVRVLAKAAGEALLRASLTGPTLTKPVTAEQKTTINPQ